MESDHLLVELYRRVAIATDKLKEIAEQSRKLGASIERTGLVSDAS